MHDVPRSAGHRHHLARVRGDNPIAIQRAAGHATFSTTEGYIRDAEQLRGSDFGVPFPPLPPTLVPRRSDPELILDAVTTRNVSVPSGIRTELGGTFARESAAKWII